MVVGGGGGGGGGGVHAVSEDKSMCPDLCVFVLIHAMTEDHSRAMCPLSEVPLVRANFNSCLYRVTSTPVALAANRCVGVLIDPLLVSMSMAGL